MDIRLLGAGQVGVDGECPVVIPLVSRKLEVEEEEEEEEEKPLVQCRQQIQGCDPPTDHHL